MASVEELLIRIDASTEQLRREMQAADKSVGDFQGKLDRHLGKIDRGFAKLDNMARGLVRSFGLLGGVLSVGGMVSFAQSTVAAADNIAKLARQIGVSSDALQEWQFAASQSGVGSKTLEDSLQRLTRRIGEARTGTGELTKIAGELGLSLGSTEDVFMQIADAIANAEDEAEATRIAFKAFDSEGRVLTRMLRGGSAGLAEFSRQARELGLVIGSDNLARAERISDQIDILNKTIRVNLQEGLLSGLAGDAETLSGAMTPELAADIRDIGRAIGEAFAWLVENREKIAQGVSILGGMAVGRMLGGGPGAAIGGGAMLGYQIGASMGDANAELAEYERKIKVLNERRAELQGEIQRAVGIQNGTVEGTFGDSIANFFGGEGRLESLRQGLANLTTQVAELTIKREMLQRSMTPRINITGGKEGIGGSAGTGATGPSVAELKKLNAELDKLQMRYDRTFASVRTYESTQSDLLKLYQAGRISLDEYTAALEAHLNAADGVADIEVKFEQAAQNVDAFATVIDEGLRRVDGMFANMWRNIIDGTGNAFDSLKSMFKNLLAELAHAALTRPIMLSLGMGASGGVSASGLASNAGSMIGSAGSFLGSAGTSILSGAALSGIGTGFGMATANMGAAGYFGAMGSNMALAGSSLSSGAIGTALGAAAPYLLPVLGGVALLGKLFQSKPSDKAQWADIDFATGGIAFGGQTGSKFSQENQDAAGQLSQMFAGLAGGLSAASGGAAIDPFRVIVGSRDGMRLADVGDPIGQRFESMDEMVRAGLDRMLDSVEGAFNASAMRVARVLSGTADEMGAAFAALTQIAAQMDVDVFAEYERAAASAGRSLTAVWRDQAGAVRDLSAELDVSADSLAALGEANAARMQLELQLLGALDAAMAQVGQTLGGTIERITLDLLDQQGQYARIRGQAEALAASLNDMVDPAAITAAVQEIDRLTNAAYGLLDDTQRQSMGGEFITFLSDVQALAEQRLNAARQDVVSESAALRDVIESALNSAAAQFASAANTMLTAASTMTVAAGNIPRTIRVQLVDQSEVNG